MFELNLYEYWQARGQIYNLCDVDLESQRLISQEVRRINPQTLIDIGCGTGPMFQYYRGIDVTGIDWSIPMLQRAIARIRENGFYVTLLHCDIAGSVLPAGHFDCGVTRTSLMHIPPTRIEKAIANIRELCDHVISDEYWVAEKDTTELAPHNWCHNYVDLFRNAGFELLECQIRKDISHIFLHGRAIN